MKQGKAERSKRIKIERQSTVADSCLEPLESCYVVGPSRTFIYNIGHNKNCIFLFLASFRPNINPFYQQRWRKADLDESSILFVLCKVQRADRRRSGDTSSFSKSFHRLAPFEVTSAFGDKGPEYSKIILSPLARPP